MKRLLPLIVGVSALVGCATPTTLQYDVGRATYAAFDAQADLTRESVKDDIYTLNGVEGIGIRVASEKQATNVEAAKSDLTYKVK